MTPKSFIRFAQSADLCPGLLTEEVVENSIRSMIIGATHLVSVIGATHLVSVSE